MMRIHNHGALYSSEMMIFSTAMRERPKRARRPKLCAREQGARKSNGPRSHARPCGPPRQVRAAVS